MRITETSGNLRVGFSYNTADERFYWKLEENKNGYWEASTTGSHSDKYQALDELCEELDNLNTPDAQTIADRISAIA